MIIIQVIENIQRKRDDSGNYAISSADAALADEHQSVGIHPLNPDEIALLAELERKIAERMDK